MTISGLRNCTPVSLDVTDTTALDYEVNKVGLVISLIPYTFHARVIESAIRHKKHVVTTSYVSDAMKALDADAKEAGITEETGVAKDNIQDEPTKQSEAVKVIAYTEKAKSEPEEARHELDETRREPEKATCEPKKARSKTEKEKHDAEHMQRIVSIHPIQQCVNHTDCRLYRGIRLCLKPTRLWQG